MNPSHRSTQLPRALALLLLLAPFAQPQALQAGHESDDPYGYLRVVEGDIELLNDRYSDSTEVTVNQPILVGDRYGLARNARAELVLPNGDLLRLGGSTDLAVLSLADSPDRPSRETHFRLLRGEIQVVILERPRDAAPRIETHNANVYFHRAGTYAVRVGGEDWTEVVVREGYAEVETDRGSLVVRDGEQAILEGESWPRSSLEVAGSLSPVERWGERLSEEAERWADSETDTGFGYAGSSLSDHGAWVEIGDRRAWRPRVTVGWEPYTDGYWYTTPSGLTWVSHEPWGWVPYHYGTWDYVSGWGWVWYPGRQYAPAWVYWYWTPGYAGWCPRGWYDRHYGFSGRFSFGVYGWAGGDWRNYRHWNFARTEHLGRRDQARFTRPSQDFAREHGLTRPGRGLITTDTRGIDREVLAKPEEPIRVLTQRPDRKPLRDSDLPDVTPFIAREPLSPDVERVVTRPEKPSEVETPRLSRKPAPLVPEEEGKPEAGARPSRRPVTEPVPGVEEKPARGAKPVEVEEPRPYRRPEPATPAKPRETEKPVTEQPPPRLERRPAPTTPAKPSEEKPRSGRSRPPQQEKEKEKPEPPVR
ncbi:MAG TPA: DUF6600 domain-containing protein [Thermoanaerobaculia bacterium]|nr:DUF6600 domain-containing protein [Thermoanaerobaculia bacterium]